MLASVHTGRRLFMRGRKACKASVAGQDSTEPACSKLHELRCLAVVLPLAY